MSIPLAEALEQVDLKDGQTYRCQVNGRLVEVRVLAPSAPGPAGSFSEDDVMLDAWVELPRPTGGTPVRSKLGRLPLPDPPVIPPEDDQG